MQMPVLITSIRAHVALRLAVLDDVRYGVPVADDHPAVARRVVHPRRHEADAFGAPEKGDERGERRGLYERDVAVEDEDVAWAEVRLGGKERVGRSQLVRLAGKGDARPRQASLDRVAAVSGDYDYLLGREGGRDIRDVADHRPSHDWMGDLRERGAHPRAHAGRQYHAVKPFLHRRPPFFRRPSR